MEFIPSSDLVQTLLPYISHGKNDQSLCQHCEQEVSSQVLDTEEPNDPRWCWEREEGGMSSALPPESGDAEPKWHRGCAGPWVLLLPRVSLPSPWMSLGAGGQYSKLCLQKGGGELAPGPLSAVEGSTAQCTVVLILLSPSHLSSAAASLRHRFATRDTVLTLPVSQEA